MTAKFGMLQQTRGLHLHAKFRLNRFIQSLSGGEIPPILPFFGLRHFVVSPVSSNLRMFNTDAQLQTFPIQWYQNRFYTPTHSSQNRGHKL